MSLLRRKKRVSYVTIPNAKPIIGGGYFLQMEITNTSRRRQRAVLFGDQPQATWLRPGIRTKSVGADFTALGIWARCCSCPYPPSVIRIEVAETYIRDFNIASFEWAAFWRVYPQNTLPVTKKVRLAQGNQEFLGDISENVICFPAFYNLELDIPPKTTIVVTFDHIGQATTQSFGK